MKFSFCLLCASLVLNAVSPAVRAQELDRLGAQPFDPLAPAEREYWKRTSGHWDFDKNVLTGTGSSRIDYTRQFLAPIHITFKMEVLDGVRTRVYFGRYTLAHEGFSGRLFGIFPSQNKHKRFKYETGRKYPVRIDITRRHMEVSVEGHVLDSRDAGLDMIPSVGFSSGDDYSNGMTRFSNIRIEGVPSSVGSGN